MDNIYSVTLNQYFDKIFCVNLDRRTDKWAQAASEFEKHGMTVERFSAIDGNTLPPQQSKLNNGEIGCSMSHAAILEMMVANSWNRILVLEDDVEFIADIQAFFAANIHYVPVNWSMLYLGGNHINPPVHVNGSVFRLSKTYTTSYYAITLDTAKGIINRIKMLNAQVDVVYSQFHAGGNCFTFKPSVAWQRPGFSDVQNSFIDYTPVLR